MANINRVILVGNLTRDPELRHTPSGTPVCKLRLAVNSRQKDAATGEWVEKPNYFDVTVWGNQAESCAQYLSKGRPVGVDGRLDWREWEAQDGTKRQAVEIVADTRPVPRQPRRRRRRRRRRRAPVRARRCRSRTTPTSRPAPTTTSRSRSRMAQGKEQQRRRKRPGAAGAGRSGSAIATSARTRSTRSTTRTSTSCGATSPRRERSARRRITGACRRHQIRSRSR